MPTPLLSAIERLIQISVQGAADTRNLLQSVLSVQLGGVPHAIPIPQVAPAGGGGGGGAAAAGRGGPSIMNKLGTFAGGLARRFAPRFSGAIGAVASTGPIGTAVAAIIAVAAALATMPKIIEDFGTSLLNANQHLAQFSSSMAAVFLRSHIRDVVRNVQIGGATSASAQRLADALGDLKDTNRTLAIAWANLKNDVGTALIRLVEPLAKALAALVTWLEKAGILSASGPADPLFQNVIVDFTHLEAARRAANDARFRQNPFAR